ncbi:hypothetical protein GBAR_LOCUS1057, partial [Geodia barretti]
MSVSSPQRSPCVLWLRATTKATIGSAESATQYTSRMRTLQNDGQFISKRRLVSC